MWFNSFKFLKVFFKTSVPLISSDPTFSKDNIGFVFDYIFTEGFQILSHDIGDVFPRKVIYFPSTGVMKVKRLRSLHEKQESLREEKAFLDDPSAAGVRTEGEIELF